jgi:hypothetical protein
MILIDFISYTMDMIYLIGIIACISVVSIEKEDHLFLFSLLKVEFKKIDLPGESKFKSREMYCQRKFIDWN